uniref:Uncharacterized protein n=1 Tax=Timema shepardi TaxID=629360 RepID=A0A7R9BC88_TIMSH|nr:unnamed protein product [Timema shepardi]
MGWIKIISGGTAIAGAVIVAYKLYRYLRPDCDSTGQEANAASEPVRSESLSEPSPRSAIREAMNLFGAMVFPSQHQS